MVKSFLPNILLVEDNESDLKSLQLTLANIEANLIHSRCAKEALEKVKGIELALAILNIELPVTSSYDLATKINSERQNNKAPIIFLSDKEFDDKEEKKCYSYGAVDCISKPFSPSILESKVKAFINLQKKGFQEESKLLDLSIKDLTLSKQKLKDANAELSHVQQFNQALLNSIPGIFYLYTLPKLELVQWNKRHETIFGFEPKELQNRSILDWKIKSKNSFKRRVISKLSEDKQVTLEAELQSKDGIYIPFLLTALKFKTGNQEYLMGVGTDISESKKIEQALTHNELVLTRAQKIAHVGSWEYDYSSCKLSISDETYLLLGLQPQNITPTLELFFDMVHPEDLGILKSKIESVKKTKIPLSIDLRIILSDGQERIIHKQAEITFDADGNPVKWLGTLHDITKRKQIEAELSKSLEQLHQLSKHIENARENERLNLARELHDDLGQALTAVKIDLQIIKKHSTEDIVQDKLEDAKQLIGSTIKTVQRITSQLRPEILEDLGLEAAIDWYANEFSQRYGIEIFLDIENNIPVSNEDALPIFRIMQESLTNIARHAKATHIEISLCTQGKNILFTISDNGKGISANEINSKKSFGIMSMKERTAFIGGTFDISPGAQFGSEISICLPIKKD